MTKVCLPLLLMGWNAARRSEVPVKNWLQIWLQHFFCYSVWSALPIRHHFSIYDDNDDDEDDDAHSIHELAMTSRSCMITGSGNFNVVADVLYAINDFFFKQVWLISFLYILVGFKTSAELFHEMFSTKALGWFIYLFLLLRDLNTGTLPYTPVGIIRLMFGPSYMDF